MSHGELPRSGGSEGPAPEKPSALARKPGHRLRPRCRRLRTRHTTVVSGRFEFERFSETRCSRVHNGGQML